jgi:hypothetical protein
MYLPFSDVPPLHPPAPAPPHHPHHSTTVTTLSRRRPQDRLLLYEDPDFSAFGSDAFRPDLDKQPLFAFAGEDYDDGHGS